MTSIPSAEGKAAAPVQGRFVRLLKLLGPGIIAVLSWLGAGDLITSSVAGANYGYAMMWVLAVSLLLRYLIVNIIARFQLCNNQGMTILQGYAQLNPFFAWFLLVYALLSFLLLGTRRWPVSMLPAMGALVYAFAVGLSLLFALLVWAAARGGSALDSAGSMRAAQEVIEAQRLAYGEGSWAQANVQRLADLRHMVGGILITGPEIFGMFLIGAWFARSGALADPARFASLYARLRWIAMPVGVVLMLASAAWHPYLAPGEFTVRTGLSYAMAAVASLLMALGYLGWIVQARHALGWLAAPGRMALSHYLLQSLLLSLIHI